MTPPQLRERSRPALRLKGVSKSYSIGGLEFPVLHDVDMEVGEGEVVVVTGAAGAGKSSLLNLVGGLERPTSGALDLLGHDVTEMGDAELSELRRLNIGVIPQVFTLPPDQTAEQIVAGHARPTAEARAVLEVVGIARDESRTARHMPIDIRRRLLVARAMMRGPDLLVCDLRRDQLDDAAANAATAVNSRFGTTVVLVSQSGYDEMGDVCFELDSGRVSTRRRMARSLTRRPAFG